MANTKDKLILLDADVLIHFFKGEELLLLPKLYPNRLLIIQEVINELKTHDYQLIITTLINTKLVRIYEIPKSLSANILYEIAKIQKEVPSAELGERVCMAIAKHDNKIVASSNIKDIKSYCSANKIEYLTTMDILVQAYQQEIIDEADADYFIYNVKSKGSKLPCNTIKEYLEKK
jgi:hypothetical protein